MTFRSPLPDVSIPEISLPDFALANARRRGDRPALIDASTGTTLSFADLAGAVERVAGSLVARGLAKGDVCAIYSPNLPEFVIAFLAIASAGGTVTTANPLYTIHELVPQFIDSRVKIIFTTPALAGTAVKAAEQAGVKGVITFGETEGAIPFAELMRAGGKAPQVPVNPAEDLVALPYSSGTTGLPKGVMLTHRNLVANIVQIDATGHFRDGEETLISYLPFYHIYGMVVVMCQALYRGATMVVVPRFDLTRYLDLVELYRATFLHVVPPTVLALAQHPAVNGRDFSSVRTVFSGGAPLGADLSKSCSERLDCEVRQGYGMTEASPTTHCNGRTSHTKYGSIGKCVPNTECIIVEMDSGKPLGCNQDGELWIRGPQIMKGYLNQPAATRQALHLEGWLRTGDVGHVDGDGDFFIVDRLKEMIKYKGLQIAPAELESVVLAHPSVADVAVIPIPDETAGEVPAAFVVLKAPVAEAELAAFVAERVAAYKKIRCFEIVDAIPKSPSGKILRRVLRERVRANSRTDS
jgi:acyl-CoA synthetase (AMP-forming)/AMP-acid ligase II